MADRLDTIRAREAAASREPWETSIVDPGIILADGKPIAVFGGNQQDYCNAEFAARARTDVPWLLAELDRERAARIEAEAKLAIREGQVDRLSEELADMETGLGLNEEAVTA